MRGYVEERVVKVANYILDNKTTIRETAKVFGISKSSLHKDVSSRLRQINSSLADDVHELLVINRKEGQRLGGVNTGIRKRALKVKVSDKKAV